MKVLCTSLLAALLGACTTTEEPALDMTKVESVPASSLPTPDVQVKILYDVDGAGNVKNIRIRNREEIKDEQFITQTIATFQKRKIAVLPDGRKPPVKDAEAVVAFIAAD